MKATLVFHVSHADAEQAWNDVLAWERQWYIIRQADTIIYGPAILSGERKGGYWPELNCYWAEHTLEVEGSDYVIKRAREQQHIAWKFVQEEEA